MDNKTKILIGVALAGVAYFLWKKKSSTASVDLPVEKIDEQFKKELPKETPATPASPETPVVTPSPAPSPASPTPAPTDSIPKLPDFDFEQYFKDNPIKFDIDTNIGSSLVNTNVVSTDPFAAYQNCITLAKYFELKNSGAPIPPDTCIIGTGNPISEKDRLQNAFQMRDVQNELSRDAFGNLNAFMQQGKDYTQIFDPNAFAGDNYGGGETSGGGGLSDRQRDLFRMGYGGDFSA